MNQPPFFYWANRGRYQAAVEALNKLVPVSGPCPDAEGRNRHLDLFRRASNAYYDLFNNGLCNRGAEFRALLKVGRLPRSPYTRRYDYAAIESQGKVDAAMDKRILRAAKEQGIHIIVDQQDGDVLTVRA